MESVIRAAARSYRTPGAAVKLIQRYPPLVLAGVTAAGKNTAGRMICRDSSFKRLVTYTTRPSRGSEQSGTDYWFLSESDLFETIKQRTLIETQVIHDFVYGTPLEGYVEIVKGGQRVLMTIDVNGASLLSSSVGNLRPHFLIPPSYEVWMQRLGSRDFLSDGERNRRLHSAAEEISTALANSSFIFVVSDDVEQTVREVTGGMVASPESQRANRQLASELYEYIKNQ